MFHRPILLNMYWTCAILCFYHWPNLTVVFVILFTILRLSINHNVWKRHLIFLPTTAFFLSSTTSISRLFYSSSNKFISSASTSMVWGRHLIFLPTTVLFFILHFTRLIFIVFLLYYTCMFYIKLNGLGRQLLFLLTTVLFTIHICPFLLVILFLWYAIRI